MSLGDVLGAGDDRIALVAERLDLSALLRCLRRREREALWLRFIHELPQSEIAELLGVSQVEVSRTSRSSHTGLCRAIAVAHSPAAAHRRRNEPPWRPPDTTARLVRVRHDGPLTRSDRRGLTDGSGLNDDDGTGRGGEPAHDHIEERIGRRHAKAAPARSKSFRCAGPVRVRSGDPARDVTHDEEHDEGGAAEENRREPEGRAQRADAACRGARVTRRP